MSRKFNGILATLYLFVISIVLTACGGLLPRLNGQGNSQATNTSNVPITGTTPSVTVKDQSSDGSSVVVEDVVSPGPGWMVIHNQVNGTVGDAIGETPLQNGDNKNVAVKIDPSKATPVLYAMLHTDAGTVGKYEFPGPDVPVMFNNDMVSPPFNVSLQAASAGTATPDMGMAMSTPGTGSNPVVKVTDQALSGDSVMIEDVVSAGPGWVVIYTTNASGQPDQPIGHAAVKDGDNPMVMVQVDPGKAQGTLVAQLHADKGTSGTFEYPGADEPVMVGVQMIASTFKVLTAQTNGAATPVVLQPGITVADQEVKNGTVTIPQVVSNGNWWLVIHRQDTNGTMGEYIGQALIKNGINTNVVVKINSSLATPVLYAMLHEDNAPVGILEFPGSDVPVLDSAGQMIAPSFKVTGLSQDVTISIKKISDTVSFLTDQDGRSLYLSLKDAPGKSNCTGDCLKSWKPLIVKGRVVAGQGVNSKNLGVITLPDGSHQVTYLGAPLYTYSKDVNPGDTTGHGLEGSWFLVTP